MLMIKMHGKNRPRRSTQPISTQETQSFNFSGVFQNANSSLNIPSSLQFTPKSNTYKSPQSSLANSINGSPHPIKGLFSQESPSNFRALAEYENDIQKKRFQVAEANKRTKQLEQEIEKLKFKLKEKENENLNLSLKIESLENQRSNYPQKQQSVQEAKLKKLQETLKTQEQEFKQKFERETSFLRKQVLESCQRIKQLEHQNQALESQINSEMQRKIRTLEAENPRQVKIEPPEETQTKQEFKLLETHFKDLEEMQNKLVAENEFLKKEMSRMEQSGKGNFSFVSRDIHKIKEEVVKVLRVLESIKEGREVSLKVLLGIEEEQMLPPNEQVLKDIKETQESLKSLRHLLADYYAELSGHDICNQQ